MRWLSVPPLSDRAHAAHTQAKDSVRVCDVTVNGMEVDASRWPKRKSRPYANLRQRAEALGMLPAETADGGD